MQTDTDMSRSASFVWTNIPVLFLPKTDFRPLRAEDDEEDTIDVETGNSR